MSALGEKAELARQQAAVANERPAAPSYSEEHVVTDGLILPELGDTDVPPPAYGEHRDRMDFSQPGINAGAAVTGDGRVDINISTKNRLLAELLGPLLERQVSHDQLPPAYIPPSLASSPDGKPPPPMNVVVQIVGSRGDVQPFVALGKVLKEQYGHRVRIATHATFQKFVEENGLEFFSIGGDPAELMAFMVKHPGLMPGMDALKSGEVTKRRQGIEEMLQGCWRSCIERGNGLGPPPKPHRHDETVDTAEVLNLGDELPFVADAIIANPPSFAHIHLAEKMGIPLHMMFTMPWTATRAFPHPLANIKSSNADDIITNNLTYTLVEMMTWQGLGDIINRFREKVLDIPALSLLWAPGLLTRLKTPYTYCWSPALIPKPNDWGQNIDISGFYFLDLATNFTPDAELDAFLKAGPPPVYIGFGSIVVDDPNAMTRMIFDAIHLSGVRALVSKGWGGLGADDVGLPEGVYMLGNVPHDWLFQHVSAVVHHGGAGTTAAGIKAGKPTFVVPFFGDQPFWGAMVARADAGPEPIPYKKLTAESLAESIQHCLKPETIEKAKSLGEKIREEEGTDVGGRSFHAHLDIEALRCSIAPSRVAVWRVRRTKVRLSAFSAAVLVRQGLIKYSDLKLYRSMEHDTEDTPIDPVSAGASSLVADLSGIGMAIADFPRDMNKARKARKQKEKEKATASTSDLTSQAQGSTDSASVNQGRTDIGPSAVSTTGATSEDRAPPTLPTSSDASVAQPATEEEQGIALETAVSAAKNVERVVSIGVKSPMNFCLGLARGFRNIPRLYNDDTVRPVGKVTDLASGIRTAGKELGYGFYDGISGLVTQPIRGAEKEGAAGLVKGFGKGVAGLIAKPGAGIWGLPAYMMQGVHAEVNKLFSRSVANYIITSRVQQGQIELQHASAQEQMDVTRRWETVKWELQRFYQLKRTSKGKANDGEAAADDMAGRESSPSPSEIGFSKPKRSWLQQRLGPKDKEYTRARRAWKDGYVEANVPSSDTGESPLESAELEQAIQASVRETSRGNAEEDARVEAAMRQSIHAMEDREGQVPGMMPAGLPGQSSTIFEDDEYKITDDEYQKLIEEAIQQSVTGKVSTSSGHLPDIKRPSGPIQRTETDLYTSMNAGPALPPRDAEFDQAIEASKADMEKTKAQQGEEDIIMEYIKKQSLAEEEFRKQKTGQGSSHDNDEGLNKALEESLKLSGQDPAAGPSQGR